MNSNHVQLNQLFLVERPQVTFSPATSATLSLQLHSLRAFSTLSCNQTGSLGDWRFPWTNFRKFLCCTRDILVLFFIWSDRHLFSMPSFLQGALEESSWCRSAARYQRPSERHRSVQLFNYHLNERNFEFSLPSFRYFSDANFTGTIPESYFNLSQLYYWYNSNKISGEMLSSPPFHLFGTGTQVVIFWLDRFHRRFLNSPNSHSCAHIFFLPFFLRKLMG